MADGTNGDIWTTVGAGGIGAAIGVIGTVLTALINRQPPLAALIDARMKTLIEGYEHRIDELNRHITRLEKKIDTLTRALDEATGRGFGH